MFRPKLFTTLKDYSTRQFLADSAAGVVVGIVAIPLAVAFAIASGVTPDKGLLTAVIAGFIVSALGGSRVQIGGPTGAFIVIVYGIVQKYGVDGLILSTCMAGVILMVMGFAGFGTAIKFIPHTVVVGFTSGIAVIIFSSEMKDFLGLRVASLPAEFAHKWQVIFAHAGEANATAVGIACFTTLLIAVWPRISRRFPGAFVALIVTSAAVHFFRWPVETIGSRFGDLPHTIPMPHLPVITLEAVQRLIQPASTIALLGAVESLLSAVVADGMIGSRHRSNTELIAQGVANIACALFGGMPATGAIARTATNVKNGGRTPIAGIIHAITILAAMLFFGQWIKLVPTACLAGILVIVSYNMSEWRSFLEILRGSRGGIVVLLTTFGLTVFADLTVAIEIGMVMAAFVFINRMTQLTSVSVISREIQDSANDDGSSVTVPVPAGVDVFEINGPFFFGVASKFEEVTRVVAKKPVVRVLRLRNVTLIDSTGLRALKSFYHQSQKQGIRLLISGLHGQPMNEMMKSELYDLIGETNVFSALKDALAAAEKITREVP